MVRLRKERIETGGTMQEDHEKYPTELLSPSQAIRQVCDILDVIGTPATAVKKIKKLCWNISDYHTLQQGGEE